MSEWLDTSGAPLGSGVAVVPHDSTVLDPLPRALYIGGTGTLVVVCFGDTAPVTLTAVQAGTLLPIRVKIVKATGTTATALVAFS